MCSKVIKEWLSEYKILPDSEVHTYAATLRNNDELINALYKLFEEDLSQEVVDPVCHQLFEFYRSTQPELKRFTLEFVPTLIQVYLTTISRNAKRKCGGIEVCLLGIYNLEIVNKDGSARVQTFTIPTLAMPSIYHEPPSLATLALTESTLQRYHSDEPVLISTGPHPQVEALNAQNRLSVLTHVLGCYIKDIGTLSTRSHSTLCTAAVKLTKAGFANLDEGCINLSASINSSSSSRSSKRSIRFSELEEPRIPMAPGFLVELLNAAYYIMFNGLAEEGIQALEAIHTRALYELYPDVLLVANGIRNSLVVNPSGQPTDGPIGISLALSPTASNPGFNKTAITNASFRTKKLPDDIPERPPSPEPVEASPERPARRMSAILSIQLPGRGRKGSKVEKDIEVPDEEDGDGPPQYEDVMESDKSKSHASARIAKPLKSIMKKAERSFVSRRESDSKRRSDIESSPRHSFAAVHASNSLASVNGDVADPSMVSVSVVSTNSRTVVDQIEMRPTSISGIISSENHTQHIRTSSNSESNYSFSEENRDTPDKPLLHHNANRVPHLQNEFNADNSSLSSNGSINTPL